MSVLRGQVIAVALALTASCGSSPPPAAHVRLSGNVVAKVGEVPITSDLVAAVAARQHSSPREALDALIDDALAAEAAHAQGLDTRVDVAWALASTRARLATERIAAESRAKGPPTDEEVAQATDRRWRDFDLPERVRVIHAIVPRKDVKDPIQAARLASQVREAVLGARDDKEFEQAARAVPAAGFTVEVESLPAFTPDGRIVERDAVMDRTFATAAFALTSPGDTSPVVETSFGWHVIRLLEKLPAHRIPLEERRVALADSIYGRRAREAYEATLKARVGGSTVTIEPSADELMASAVAKGP
jgi:parvulin-like peptidyl-prolyl isomerase